MVPGEEAPGHGLTMCIFKPETDTVAGALSKVGDLQVGTKYLGPSVGTAAASFMVKQGPDSCPALGSGRTMPNILHLELLERHQVLDRE